MLCTVGIIYNIMLSLHILQEGYVYCVGGGFSVALSVRREVPPTYYDPVFIEGKAVILLHNLQKEQHLQIPLAYRSLEYPIISFCKE